jgi:hypothetical protein
MTVSVEELIRSAADGTIGAVLDDPANLTPELAGEARAAFVQAAAAGEPDVALAAVIAASMMWLRLGDRQQAAVNYVDWQQLEYMRADTPAEYATAREGLQRAVAMADELGDRDQAFKAGGIAADCSFWASEAATAPGEKDEWLLHAMRDLLALQPSVDIALQPSVDSERRADYERFVSLLAAVATRAMSTFWSQPTRTEATDLLRQLAHLADATVPVDFSYQLAGDPSKTAATARVLARLVDEHGD